MQYFIAGLIGLISGITSGLFGVGGGVVMVPTMLLLLHPPVRDIKQAIGTSLAVIIATGIVGTVKHHQLRNVAWDVVLMLVPTAIIGGFFGAWLTTYIPAENLKRAFGVFIIVVGCKLAFLK